MRGYRVGFGVPLTTLEAAKVIWKCGGVGGESR